MKFLTEKRITHKIIIALVIVILFNFVSPRIVFADASDVGGILFEPIKDLLLVIADGIVTITQIMLFQTESSFITLEHNSSWISSAAGWIVRNRCSTFSSWSNCNRSNYRRS